MSNKQVKTGKSAKQSKLSNVLFTKLVDPHQEVPKGIDEKERIKICRGWTLVEVALGNLFVRGYRIFKKMVSEQCLILYKRHGWQTEYGYFKIMEDCPPDFWNKVNLCIQEINHLKRRKSHKANIIICYCLEQSCLEVSGSDEAFIESTRELCGRDTLRKDDLICHFGKSNCLDHGFSVEDNGCTREISQDSSEQFMKLKEILFRYIDTFGSKYKGNYYADLEKECLTSYKIGLLINTISCIVYREMSRPSSSYSQIESASWTFFLSRQKVLKYDRKDIVMSGNSRILFLDLLFLTSLDRYIDQTYKVEVNQMLTECRKAYTQATVKVIRITNEINCEEGDGLMYKYESRQVGVYRKQSNTGNDE